MGKRIAAVLLSLCMIALLGVGMAGCGSQGQDATTGVYSSDTVQPTSAVLAETVTAPKYVLYMIGDGLGAAQRQLAEYYMQEQTGDPARKLMMNTLPVAGMNTTHALDTLVTDSAAAGTALATGVKTDNGLISMTPDGKTLPTVMEKAISEKGMATGLVSTTRITHATPAVFAAHNMDRDDENGVADAYVESGVDFFAGGGLRHFLPASYTTEDTDAMGAGIKSKREDERNLINEFESKGYKTFTGSKGADAFMDYQPSAGDKVFAAFTGSHMPYELDSIHNNAINAPSLAQMTNKAIDLLSRDDDGFVLMVEGGRIDHACHANDVMGTIGDVLAFDNAVRVAYNFYLQHPDETLLLVVADHETGGLGLGFGTDYFIDFDPLAGVKYSVEDVLQGAYDGDRDAFYAYIAGSFSLSDLSDEETAMIEAALDNIDETVAAGETPGEGYGGYNPAAIAVTHILSERANVQWTTYAHSGTAIPMSAIGNSSDLFGGYKDNTEIGLELFQILGL